MDRPVQACEWAVWRAAETTGRGAGRASRALAGLHWCFLTILHLPISAGCQGPGAELLQPALGSMQPVAEAGAPACPGSAAAVAGLHSRHTEHSSQDGGPARVPSCLQPALRLVRECSTSQAPGRPTRSMSRSGQPRRACTGAEGGKPLQVPSRPSHRSRGRNDAYSFHLQAEGWTPPLSA